MEVLQIMILGILLLIIPTGVGVIFSGVDKNIKKLPFLWISGQIALWAGFQVLCVPMVLLERDFREVVTLFQELMAVLLLAALFVFLKQRKQTKLHVIKEATGTGSICYKLAWVIFWALLLFQLVQTVLMTYADGDDAYYVAVSTFTEHADVMYQKIPYTGYSTELDARHGLAPFPVWIAFLAKVSGMETVSVAHIAVPLAMLPMTYGIYYLLAGRIFAKKKENIPVFLIFTELLVLFGDYSFYTVENFMIARSRQGKAALGSILIPMLIFLLLLLLEKVQESQKIPFMHWILLAATLTASCLCSTLGALLTCMLVGITGLCAAFVYKKWRFLIPMAVCCIPCVVYAGLYLLLA